MKANVHFSEFERSILVEALINEASRGTIKDYGFRSPSWRRILAEVRCKTRGQFECSVQNLQNQFSELKKKYFLSKELQEMEGFTFDKETSTLFASDQRWEEVMSMHQAVKRLRNKPMAYYRELDYIFSRDVIGSRTPIDYTELADQLSIPPAPMQPPLPGFQAVLAAQDDGYHLGPVFPVGICNNPGESLYSLTSLAPPPCILPAPYMACAPPLPLQYLSQQQHQLHLVAFPPINPDDNVYMLPIHYSADLYEARRP
jgi:hypothetical protein